MMTDTLGIALLAFIAGLWIGAMFTLWVFKAIATYKGDSNHD